MFVSVHSGLQARPCMVGVFCAAQGLSYNSQSIVDYVPVWLVYSVLLRVCLVTHSP
jgi:hypothetical protein